MQPALAFDQHLFDTPRHFRRVENEARNASSSGVACILLNALRGLALRILPTAPFVVESMAAGAGLMWLIAIAPAAANTVGGVDLPRFLHTRAGVLELALCGVRHTLWVEHYVTAVYVPHGQSMRALQDRNSAKAVLLHMIETQYLPREIPRKWRRALERALDRKAMSKVRAAYQALRDGDVLAILYTPREGVSLSVNGGVIVRARGHGVIDSVLATWRGGKSIRAKLDRAKREHRCS